MGVGRLRDIPQFTHLRVNIRRISCAAQADSGILAFWIPGILEPYDRGSRGNRWVRGRLYLRGK